LKNLAIPLLSVLLLTGAKSAQNDQRTFQAIYDQFSAAIKAKDLDKVMSFYAPNVVAFDAFIPRQYVGAPAYRKSYEQFFAEYPGPATSEITDFHVSTAGNQAIAYGIDRWVVTGMDGKAVEVVFRFTNVFRKINGKWLAVHEHLSFPADPATGMADYLSKP
jgi:ketosteroid isomerase-like protein